MTSTHIDQTQRLPRNLIAWLWAGTLVAGVALPGGGIVAAIIASFTIARRTRSALVGMWVIAGILGFLTFCVYFPFPSVSTIGPAKAP